MFEQVGMSFTKRLRMDKDAYVSEMKHLDDGEMGNITLDSGAGVSVWPYKIQQELESLPRNTVHRIAANGTTIKNFGQKMTNFKGIAVPFAQFSVQISSV